MFNDTGKINYSKNRNDRADEVQSPPLGRLVSSPCSALSPEIMYIPGGAVIWARQVFSSDIFFNKPDKWFKIWFYIVGNCNHKDNQSFKRGDNFFTYRQIIDVTKATRNQIDHFIRWAKKKQMLATRKTTRGLVITVMKYDVYQELDNYKSDTESDIKATQKRHRSDTINKNDKNDKKKRENIVYIPNSKVPPTLDSVIKYFGELKQPNEANPFYDHFQSNGWKVGGKAPMKDWKAAARNWCRRDFRRGAGSKSPEMVQPFKTEKIEIPKPTEEEKRRIREMINKIGIGESHR